MDQEDTMDFKALRAKFQAEDIHMKQPRMKPALPEKPRVFSPPQSPTHYLPAGARPSLLTSLSMEGKGPRVVFKDDKKESKKPLIPSNSKGKSKSEGKVKKDKTTKGSKEKLDGNAPEEKKEKKESKRFSLGLHAAAKESTEELVSVTPTAKDTVSKKKGFMGFKKATKKVPAEVPAEPILDSPSSSGPGLPPLIPVPSEFSDILPEPLLPDMPTLPDSIDEVELTPPFTVPDSPGFNPPPAFIPEVPTPQSETPLHIETPSLPTSRPTSRNEIIQRPPSAAPTPPPSLNISAPSPVASIRSPSPPVPESPAEASIEAVNIAAVETPPPSVVDTALLHASPKAERPISALSALSRAEDMNPGRRTPADLRVFNALEKARRKISSPQSSYSVTPEAVSRSESPTPSLPEIPPIDYEDRARKGLPLVNGLDHGEVFPVLEGINEEGSEPLPELMVVPPPPPRKALPDLNLLGPDPEKPDRPPFVNLSEFTPPHPTADAEESSSAHPELSEMDTTDVPEFDDVGSNAHSPEMQVLDWGNEELNGPATPEPGQSLSQFFANGITTPGTDSEVHAPNVSGGQDNPPPEASSPVSQESPAQAGGQAEVDNGVYEGTDNSVYEDVQTTSGKKRGKTGSGKKRKGPPKNPYAEAAQETAGTVNGEKSKTGRFGKSDKKAAAAAEGPDEKELKKREKQRLEKEKKELKEKQEREKKEQKEREKRENEIRKKFKITGHEDAMYQAKVTVTTKGRKHDLPVQSGDIISIIRTTNCPKGKWLARDSSNNYGHVAVDHVELDIKEMLELGKKAAINRNITNNNTENTEVLSSGSRASNHFSPSHESFEDDSEEWTPDDEEPLPLTSETDSMAQMGHNRTLSMPDMGLKDIAVNHQHSHSDINPNGGSHMQARHEALQKLATFFHSPKHAEPAASSTAQQLETTPEQEQEEAVQTPEVDPTQEIDLGTSDMIILPPPDLYADFTVE